MKTELIIFVILISTAVGRIISSV